MEQSAAAVVVDPVPDEVRRIAAAIRERQCVLFLGAGIHSLPDPNSTYTYSDDERPRRGGELSKHLAGLCNYAGTYSDLTNLGRVALFFEVGKSRLELIDEVRKQVQTDKRPSAAIRALAALDFRLVATTNYDTMFEDALRAHGKRPKFCIYNPDRSFTETYSGSKPEPTVSEPFVLKIHGDIDRDHSIVITDEDYIHFLLRTRDTGGFDPLPPVFRYELTTLTTLFIGYSLIDYNLRVLFKTLRWDIDKNVPLRTVSYAVDPTPDHLIQKVYSARHNFVHFIVQDIWTFVPMLYRELTGQEMPP
jgi:hypothetical protein